MELKKWLMKNRLTVNQFSRKCGLTKQTIHNYLKGNPAKEYAAFKVEEATDGEVSAKELIEGYE